MDAGATLLEQNGGGCTPDSQSVRLDFNSGGTGAGGQRGFYTTFWWSHCANVQLVNDGSGTMSVSLSDPSQWSDWNGTLGNDPAIQGAFATAVTKVVSVGLSFGGGCFFENGVTVSSGSGTFSSAFSD